MTNSKLIQHDISTNEQVEHSLWNGNNDGSLKALSEKVDNDIYNVFSSPQAKQSPSIDEKIAKLEADKAELLLALRVSNGWLDSYISKSLVSKLVEDNKKLIAKHKWVKL